MYLEVCLEVGKFAISHGMGVVNNVSAVLLVHIHTYDTRCVIVYVGFILA